jgi:hypothetical protein
VAVFESGIVQVSSPGTVSALIWNPSNTSATTFGSLGSVPASSVLKDVTVINQGTVTVYVNTGSASAASGTIGVPIPAGGQLTIQGYSGTVGTAGSLWAQTVVVGQTGLVAVGMASVASVV